MTSIKLRLLTATVASSAPNVLCAARDVQFKSGGHHTTADRALPKQYFLLGNWSWICEWAPQTKAPALARRSRARK